MKKRVSAGKSNSVKPYRRQNKKRVRARKVRSDLALNTKLIGRGQGPAKASRPLNGHARIEEIAFYRANEKPYGILQQSVSAALGV